MKKYDICVFGGCSIDLTFFQDKSGKYLDTPNVIVPGGKGSNQAVAASRAGAKVVMISKFGNNEAGHLILNNLTKNGIDTSGVRLPDNFGIDCSKIYIEKDSKDNQIISETGAINSFTTDMIYENKELILSSKIVIAQMKAPKEVDAALINFCYDNDIPIVITPCRPEKLKISDVDNIDLINKISYITANRKECETIFETKDIEACVRKYPNKLIVTLGSDGVMYYDGEKIRKFESIKVDNIVDTTGAGDTFNGNLVAMLTKEVPLDIAIEKAQFASAMKLLKSTAQAGMPNQYELENFIREYNSKDFKYKSEFNLIYEKIMIVSNEIKKLHKTINKKPDKTFVTTSDTFIENFLTSEIKKQFPNDNFVSEEFNSSNIVHDRTWIIDPIDGTHHYMKNSIFWGIQVAFAVNNETQFSIIYLPKLNEVYYALKGYGTFLNNLKVSFNEPTPLDYCNVEFCGSLNKFFEEKSKILKKLIFEDIKVANIMHINACCIAFTNLISSRTDAMILSTIKPWDIMPGMFLLEEYGLTPTTIGNLKIYSKSAELTKYLLK